MAFFLISVIVLVSCMVAYTLYEIGKLNKWIVENHPKGVPFKEFYRWGWILIEGLAFAAVTIVVAGLLMLEHHELLSLVLGLLMALLIAFRGLSKFFGYKLSLEKET